MPPKLDPVEKKRRQAERNRRRKSTPEGLADHARRMREWRRTPAGQAYLKRRDAAIMADPEKKAKAYEQNSTRQRTDYQRLRANVLSVLGGRVCKRCGFTDVRALQIDHINGGGSRHRRSRKNGHRLLLDVLSSPQDYQVLCANCNWIKRWENDEHNFRRLTSSSQ